jgi:hypothetical protein
MKTAVNIKEKIYETKKVTDEVNENLKIFFDEVLDNWNYRAVSQNG